MDQAVATKMVEGNPTLLLSFPNILGLPLKPLKPLTDRIKNLLDLYINLFFAP